MTHCPLCKESLAVTALTCLGCKTEYRGDFAVSRLARLGKEERGLAEALILHGGNLKEMAQALQVSYPTLKKRLTALSLSFQALKQSDEAEIERILTAMEEGRMGAKEGVKRIREINGEL